jgi:transcriptional regulator with XRE-family HTH domain
MARRTIEVRKPRDIGDAIVSGREARGISQEELAQANAYDRFYLNKLEAGGITVHITRLLHAEVTWHHPQRHVRDRRAGRWQDRLRWLTS